MTQSTEEEHETNITPCSGSDRVAHFDVFPWEPQPIFQAGASGGRVQLTGRVDSNATKNSVRQLSFQLTPDANVSSVYTYPPATVEHVQALAQSSQRHLRIALCGSKGTGKSTTVKFILNTFLSASSCPRQVYIINADVGQTELTPPGIIAAHRLDRRHQFQPLQGSNFINTLLCSTDPIASYFIGTVS